MWLILTEVDPVSSPERVSCANLFEPNQIAVELSLAFLRCRIVVVSSKNEKDFFQVGSIYPAVTAGAET